MNTDELRSNSRISLTRLIVDFFRLKQEEDSDGLYVKTIRIFRFGLSGGISTMIHMGVVVLLVELTRLHPVPSSAVAFLCAVIVSYLLQRNWTFQAAGSHRRQFVRYFAVTFSGLLLNLLLMYTGVEILKLWYFFALSITVILVSVWSYTLHRRWTFER